MIGAKALIYSSILGIIASLDLSSSEEFDKWSYDDKTCDDLLEHYANTSASFTYCAVKNARPIRICELCVQFFQSVTEAHDLILKVEDGSGNKVCKEQLMNLDRLEVIEEGFKYISDLWHRASCDKCFLINNSTMEISNSTLDFMTLLNTTNDCFKKYLVNGTYNESVCIDCETFYCRMNKNYDSLKTTQGDVCMDIVDSMNITRMKWNDELHCKKDAPRLDIIYLSCSCIFATLPILFYLGAKLFTTVIRNRLQMQKRLAEILRPSTSAEAQ